MKTIFVIAIVCNFIIGGMFLCGFIQIKVPKSFNEQSVSKTKDQLQTDIEHLVRLRGQLLFSDPVADSMIKADMMDKINQLNSMK